MLNASAATAQAVDLHRLHESDRADLDVARRYYRGVQARPFVVSGKEPKEVKAMARSARINVMPLIINSLVQSVIVDGYRGKLEADDAAVWQAWQVNKMDARQTAIHRATFLYGTGYAVCVPRFVGGDVPVIRPASPRGLTAVYGEDQDWPMWALERLGHGLWRLYDDEAVYYLERKPQEGRFTFIEGRPHGLGVTPVVRYLDECDVDDEDEVESDTYRGEKVPLRGQVAPLMTLQDQIDMSTFDRQIGEHFGAFKQRYAIGWIAEDEEKLLKTSAAKLWTIDKDPESVKLGEFGQTDTSGYLASVEASMQQVAALSQTPAHELTGQLINLSAEALRAAEAGRDRKVGERKTLLGESHEQLLGLAGKIMGVDVPADAQIVWRDTSSRAFAAEVDALGKLVSMLGIPPQELWERVPGATQKDIERWKAAAANGDSFKVLADMLDRQGAASETPAAVA